MVFSWSTLEAMRKRMEDQQQRQVAFYTLRQGGQLILFAGFHRVAKIHKNTQAHIYSQSCSQVDKIYIYNVFYLVLSGFIFRDRPCFLSIGYWLWVRYRTFWRELEKRAWPLYTYASCTQETSNARLWTCFDQVQCSGKAFNIHV